MNKRWVRKAGKLLLVFSLFIVVSACSDFASNVRKVTYPPDFKYVSPAELRSHMQQLAYQMQLLDAALASDTQQVDQKKVVDILHTMESVGSNIKAGEAGSNHPFLEDYMGDFVSNVTQARLAAEQNPPRYYQAGRISGACTNCHKVNR